MSASVRHWREADIKRALATPQPVSGDTVREAIARIIDPDAWHDTLPTDGCGAYWIGRRNEARSKADDILQLLRKGG